MEEKTTNGIYSLDHLKKTYSSGRRFSFIFFNEFTKNDLLLNPVTEGCFSQFFPSQFADKNGEQYSDCIQYMFSQKAKLFQDKNSYVKIMQSNNHEQIMINDSKIKNFNQKIWDKQSDEIVYQGNLYKFSQNNKLKEFLLSFPLDTIFVDADPSDKYWGIKLDSNDPKSYNPFLWEGQNKLGFQITKVRDNLLTLISTKIKSIPQTQKVYCLKDLQKSILNGHRYIYVYFYFYKQKDLQLNPVTEGCFSQFFPIQFFDNKNREYSDCIQYMMAQKAVLFDDEDIFNEIMRMKDQYKMMSMGRKVKDFDQKVWDQNSEKIVFKANFFKFSQNEKLRDFLLSFPLNTIFVEADPDDKIWGIHLTSDDPKAKDPLKWEGENKLGFQISKVRDHLLTKLNESESQISNEFDCQNITEDGSNERARKNKLDKRTKNSVSDETSRKNESDEGMIKRKSAERTNKRQSDEIERKSDSYERTYKRQSDEIERKSHSYERTYKRQSDEIERKSESDESTNNNESDDDTRKSKLEEIRRKRKTDDSSKKSESESDERRKKSEPEKSIKKSQPAKTKIIETDDNHDKNYILSYAYDDRINQIFYSEKVSSIDLLSTGIPTLQLENYPNLKKLRASKCYYLKSVLISGMPNLRVVDLLDDQSLYEVEFKNCQKLDTLEVGFCTKLTKLTGIESLKYLSAPQCISLTSYELPKSIVFLDITDFPVSNVSMIIQKYSKIECLVFSKGSSLKLSEITSNESLKIIQMRSTKIICDSINPKTKLKIIIFENKSNITSLVEGKIELLEKFYVTTYTNTNQSLKNFTMFDDYTPKYQKYQKMLYGPWGIPKIDSIAPTYIKNPIILPPKGINHEKAADSILGSIIGSAVFDMIGVGVEFLPDGISKALLLGKMNITWSHPRINSNNRKFVRSTPTDDTSQSILILRSIIDSNTKSNLKPQFEIHNVKIDPSDFALKMIDWIQNGHKEHKHYGALDVGISTLKISKNPLFRTNPIQASEQEWISGGRRNAANGSVMRIATSGCFAFWDELVVVKVADSFSKATHFDPRCVFSAISAALLISRYIQWNSGLINNEPDIDETINVALDIVPSIGSYSSDIRYYTKCKNVEDLKLSESNVIGYCLKALGAGIWALRYCKSIEEGIVKVIREGGDADTNGAVVGALLGAKLGFSAIPEEMIKYMFVGQWLFREIDPFMKLMGIKMPPSPYLK